MKRINYVCTKNDYEKSAYVGNLLGAWGIKEIMKREWLGEPKRANFESMEIYIPQNHDKYLTKLYGDYMQLPPIEKRNSHHNYIYENLNESYLEK